MARRPPARPPTGVRGPHGTTRPWRCDFAGVSFSSPALPPPQHPPTHSFSNPVTPKRPPVSIFTLKRSVTQQHPKAHGPLKPGVRGWCYGARRRGESQHTYSLLRQKKTDFSTFHNQHTTRDVTREEEPERWPKPATFSAAERHSTLCARESAGAGKA